MGSKLSAAEELKRVLARRKEGIRGIIDLPGADLSGALLPSADLVGANLCAADLTGANLAGARLSRANLRDANLVGAALDGADLTDADLRGADLAGARIDDAVFTNARLEGGCFASVLGDPLSMADAKMDRQTVRLSEFTALDIAEMIERGVQFDEHESNPPTGLSSRGFQIAKTDAVSKISDPTADEASSLHGDQFPSPNVGIVGIRRARSFYPPVGETSIVPAIRADEVSAWCSSATSRIPAGTSRVEQTPDIGQ